MDKKMVQQVPWKDLTGMNGGVTLREMVLPLPWLFLGCALYSTPYWPLGLPFTFMFFLCALRLNHEGIHGNLGLPRWADNLILHGLSALMMSSNHAIAHSHMIHHRYEMGPEDYEGHCGDMSFWEVVRYGPKFPIDLNLQALRHANKNRRRKVIIDWILIALVIFLAVGFGPTWMLIHCLVMAIGQCMTAFFAVWITHHGAQEAGIAARSQRGPIAKVAYLMFYHREHHLFPAVPVHRLPELADRLDKIPSYAKSHLPVVPFLDRSCA